MMTSRIVIVLAFILGISVTIQSQPSSVDFGFNQSTFSGIEQGENYRIPVKFFSGGAFFINVHLNLSGTAGGNDINLITHQLRFLPGDIQQNIEFSLSVDNIAQEFNETFIIYFEVPDGTFGPGANIRNRLEGVIIDSDQIEFQLSEVDYTQNEEPNAVLEVLITKGSGVALANPVDFRARLLTVDDAIRMGVIDEFEDENPFSPNRASYEDFDNTTLFVTFPIDDTVLSRELKIPIVDDKIDEADEQVFIIFLEVINATNFNKVNVGRKTSIGRIKDDETTRIGFEFESYEVTEPEPDDDNVILNLVYLIREDNQTSEQTYSVDLTVGDPGGNTKPATLETSDINESFDYSFGLPGQNKINVFFPPTVDRIPFVFSLNPDLAVEGTETFRATSAQVTPSGDFPVYQTPSGVTAFATTLINILDNDELKVGFKELSYTVSESAGTVEVCVIVINPPPTVELCPSVTLSPSTIDGTAEAGSDFTKLRAFLSIPLVIPSSPGSPTAGPRRECFNVTITDDNLFENTESFSLLLQEDIFGQQTGATINPNRTDIFILDDEDVIPAEVQFDQILYGTIEGTNARLRIVLTGPSRRDVTVEVSTRDGTAQAPSDYSSVISQIVTIPAGEVEAFMKVSTTNDEINEVFEETFTASLSNPTNAMVGENATASIIISDDDIVLVNMDPNNYTVIEGGQVTVTAVLNREADRPLSVGFFTDDETATVPDDYEAVNRSITFPTGETTVMITLFTTEDKVAEGNEIFDVLFENPMDGLLLGTDSEAMVEILDNDMVFINFDPTVYNVTEGMSATLRLVLSTTSTEVVTVQITSVDGSATAPGDYIQFITTIEFPAGTTQLEFPVSTVEDEVNELGEIFLAKLSSPLGGGAMLGRDVDATIGIIDDDQVTIGFERIIYSVDEGDVVEVCAVLNGSLENTLEVFVNSSSGSTTVAADYIPVLETLTFGPTTNHTCFNVTTVEDQIFEEDIEDVNLHLSTMAMGITFTPELAQVHIRDDDSSPFACRNLRVLQERTRDNIITVRWERPFITERYDYYDIFYSDPEQPGNFKKHNRNPFINNYSQVTYSVSGLKPLTSYTIRVVVQNGVRPRGEEGRKCEVSDTTGDIRAQPPRSVTSLCSVIVWKAPTRTYGVITGYEVSFSLSGRDNGVIVSKNRDELFHIVRASELPRGEGDILVTVRAKTVSHNGTWSDAISLNCTGIDGGSACP